MGAARLSRHDEGRATRRDAYYGGEGSSQTFDFRQISRHIASIPAPAGVPFHMVVATIDQCDTPDDICGRTYPAYVAITQALSEGGPRNGSRKPARGTGCTSVTLTWLSPQSRTSLTADRTQGDKQPFVRALAANWVADRGHRLDTRTMPVQPRAGLPAGFTTEPATGAHAPEVFEMLAAERIAAFGFCPDSLEDVRADLEPTESQAVEHLVRDPHGSLVQWWVAHHRPRRTHLLLLDREPSAAAGRRRTTSCPQQGWATLFDWILETAPAGAGPIEVRSGCEAGSEPGHRRLHAAGFTHQRTFWEMLGPVNEETRTAAPVPGLTITASEDTRAIYEVFDKGFKDHWGYVEVPYDDWAKVQPTFSGYDPRLWFLAEVDGAPAAAMTLSRRVEADGAMYVQAARNARGLPAARHRLGTARARFRHRGTRRPHAPVAARRQREHP